MTAILAPHHRATAGLAAVLACLIAGAVPAQAEGRLEGQYTISMTGVLIGQITWLVDINDKHYVTSAYGKASGVLSMLVNGEGSVVTHGTIANDRLAPSSFVSRISDDEGNSELAMTFDGGNVKDLIGQAPRLESDRVAVSEGDRRGVNDPLTAVLIPILASNGPLASSNCTRTLPIFDGRRRYNLALAFGRVDKIALAQSYTGPVLVCGVILQPIAGYRSNSMLVKYVAGRRDLELWFAPIAGTSVIAPIRVVMPTLIGTLEITAKRFDVLAAPPAPAASPQ